MRASRMNLVTLRDDPADAEIASHRLLMRAGFLHKSGAGLYVYAPLMQRVLDKVRWIVATEIAAVDGLEITMPILQERELWQRSGRWDAYLKSKTMLTVTDRGEQVFGLAPTAEEVVTDFADHQVGSYKQLPVCYFQQHTKFRDEIRPRFGLMRVKEFVMMDAYSFHVDAADLDAYYPRMHDAYLRIFRRCGLEAFAVEADSGAIGGSASHEFMVAAEVGEDAILVDEAHGYAANVERAVGVPPPVAALPPDAPREEIHTPGAGGIAEVVAFLREGGRDVEAGQLVKTLLFVAETADDAVKVAACVRGDRDCEEVKLVNAANAELGDRGPVLALRPMTAEEVTAATGAVVGYAAPLPGLGVDLVIADPQLAGDDRRWIAGANRTDHHVVGYAFADHDGPIAWHDLTRAVAGDASPAGGTLTQRRGIEVGHIFKLGTKYSSAMGCGFTGQDGKHHPFVMGCYGIGSSRVVAAAVEQHHDERGIRWPMAIAPYHCAIVIAKGKDRDVVAAAERVYEECRDRGLEVVLDDRDLGAGIKFKDWELVGVPVRVVAGRGVADGKLELRRFEEQLGDVAIAEVADRVADLVNEELEASDG